MSALPRFYTDTPLAEGAALTLPDHAARHIQVLRLQPGGRIVLFNGAGVDEGEFVATITRMGRCDVDVSIGPHIATQREAARAVHVVVGMPANERMDWLVEKATELGVASMTPVMTERSVLRLKAERADKKLAHWRGVAVAACEQSGRNRLPVLHAVTTLSDWLKQNPADLLGKRLLLSLQARTEPLASAVRGHDLLAPLTFLSGPEGGLSALEEAAALAHGFSPVTLGARVLRAETAVLVVLAAVQCG